MIVDFHTHLFPPEIVSDRERFLAADATFRELYEDPKAKLASAEELLVSMEGAAVDVSVALGFAWQDAGLCRLHNDYLIEAARASGGQIVPFCTLPLGAPVGGLEAEMQRCLEAGVRGFGELRPDNLGFDLAGEDGERLGRPATETGTMLLFHASEPVGHTYAGKQGMRLDSLYQFVKKHPDARIIAAHWGGGLPFYALMPEVKLALTNVSFDTAGTSLLYKPEIYADVSRLTGAGSIVFGSDYPLLGQRRSRERIEAAGLPDAEVQAILGGNAARMLSLDRQQRLAEPAPRAGDEG